MREIEKFKLTNFLWGDTFPSHFHFARFSVISSPSIVPKMMENHLDFMMIPVTPYTVRANKRKFVSEEEESSELLSSKLVIEVVKSEVAEVAPATVSPSSANLDGRKLAAGNWICVCCGFNNANLVYECCTCGLKKEGLKSESVSRGTKNSSSSSFTREVRPKISAEEDSSGDLNNSPTGSKRKQSYLANPAKKQK
jgi:hypothetical protein